MGLFDGINNPWAPGGQMATRLPWAQPALDHGWGHGNEFFTPKTQEQLHQEAMLQLAILAVALVAPAVLGAGGAAGAAGAQGGIAGAQAVGMGTSAEAAAGAIGQAGMAAAGAGTGSISMSGALLAGGLSTASSMLQPFLKADSTHALQQAARVGEGQLNHTLHQMSSPRGQQVESEATRDRSPVNSLQSRIPDLRSGDLPVHAAVPMLVELAEVIGRDRGLQMEARLITLGRITKLSDEFFAKVSNTLLTSCKKNNSIWDDQRFRPKPSKRLAIPSKEELRINQGQNPTSRKSYSLNVLHFYYVAPSIAPMEWAGHFSIGVQHANRTDVLYYPAHGDYINENPALPTSATNPASEALTILNYIRSGRDVIRFTMEIPDKDLFRNIENLIKDDRAGNGQIGDSLSCLTACHDILNFATLQTLQDKGFEEIDFGDPESLLDTRNEYRLVFPFIDHGGTFPRDILNYYKWSILGMIGNANGWQTDRLVRDKIFEVNIYENQ